MSYEEGQEDFDEANGANNRFDGLDLRFKKGGHPRSNPKRAELSEASTAIVSFYRGGGLNPDLLDANPDKGLKDDMTTLDIVREMHACRKALDAAQLLEKELARQYDYLRLQLVPERFEADGIKNIKVEGIGRCQLAGDLRAKILKEDEAFEWLRDNGRGALIKETVNPSSLKAVMKDILKKGEEEIPDDVFKVDPFTRASIVKG